MYMREGARRVWRHQRILWWILALNFVLALFGTMPMASRVGKVADHSLNSQKLVGGFDIAAFVELASNPDVGFWAKTTDSLWFAVIFFVFALFLTGGILETYHGNRKLPLADFFQACGLYFWRWVRLLVFMLIVIAPLVFLASGIVKWSDTLSEDAAPELMGFWVELFGLLFVALMMMAVRLWFDMAQVRAVAENERAMRRALAKAFMLTWRNFGSLYWLYFRISFLAWLGLAVTWWIWLRIPGERIGTTFFLFEVLIAWWIGTRLWQRASETAWYEWHPELTMVATGVPNVLETPTPGLPVVPDSPPSAEVELRDSTSTPEP